VCKKSSWGQLQLAGCNTQVPLQAETVRDVYHTSRLAKEVSGDEAGGGEKGATYDRL